MPLDPSTILRRLNKPRTYDTWIREDGSFGLFEPKEERLVQKDTIVTDALCFIPTVIEEQEITLKWRLLSKDFDKTGELRMSVSPRTIDEWSTEEYEAHFPNEIRLENYTGLDPDIAQEDNEGDL